MIGAAIKRVIGMLDLVGGTDGTDIGNVGDSLKVLVTASALPTGAATAAKQDTGNIALASIDSDIDVALSTRASEATLSTINGKLVNGNDIGDVTVNNAAGAAAVNIQDGGNSITVDGTVAATQSGTWNINNISGTVSLPTGASTAANQATGNASLASIDGKLVNGNDIGDVTVNNAAGASAVNIQDGGNSITVDGTVAATQSGTWNLNNISGTVSLPTGASTAANQATGNASLASIDAGIPAALGQTVMASAMSVAIASDQTVIPVSDNGSTLTVDQATAANFNAQVVGNVASAATDSGNPVKAGAKVNTTAPTFTDGQRADLQADTHGALFVNIENRKRTYSACTAVLTVAASTTDFFTITGAASTKVKIQNIILTGEATSNAIPEVILLKRSTANSGGTSTTITAVPHDSGDAAASATVQAYTVNPTTGTLVGNLRAIDLFFSGASGNPAQILEMNFDEKAGKCPTLNSASEVIALNLAGVTVAGANFAISITWTEE